MINKKEFTVMVENELKITLDMDKYTPEALSQFREYWDLDEDLTNDEIIIELVDGLAYQFMQDGYLDKELEGHVEGGQECKKANYRTSITENV